MCIWPMPHPTTPKSYSRTNPSTRVDVRAKERIHAYSAQEWRVTPALMVMVYNLVIWKSSSVSTGSVTRI